MLRAARSPARWSMQRSRICAVNYTIDALSEGSYLGFDLVSSSPVHGGLSLPVKGGVFSELANLA